MKMLFEERCGIIQVQERVLTAAWGSVRLSVIWSLLYLVETFQKAQQTVHEAALFKDKSMDKVIRQHFREVSLSSSLPQFCTTGKVTWARTSHCWSPSGHPHESHWTGLQKPWAMTSLTVVSKSHKLNLSFRLLSRQKKSSSKAKLSPKENEHYLKYKICVLMLQRHSDTLLRGSVWKLRGH